MIDEFYLYNRALSKVEINALSQVCDFRRIVLYFGFTKIEGTRIYDQSGIANNGVFQNGTQLINGVCGRAVNFSNQGHIVLNGGQFRQKPLNGISISAWIWLNTNRYV